jgi:peptide/nickel transport system substrate-binding protein
MDDTQRRVDVIRRERSELENHIIDEYSAGKITRREFVRRGTVVGMSIPLVSFLAAACGGGGGGETTGATGGGETGGSASAGGTLKTGIIAPAGELDPLTVADEGGLAVLGQSGEYMAWSNEKLELEPRIAESWQPNDDGSVWTFKIRQGVTFHDGTPLTANDVAATLELHADPKNKGNALSAFGGVLSPGGAKAVDDATVEVTLDAPNGNFPYLVSSDNYNVIILPASYDGDWEKTFIGTGPWKLQNFTPQQGVTYTKNPDYWDTTRQPLADSSELHFYSEDQARVLAIQGGEVDILSQFAVVGGEALLNDPNINVVEVRASQHRQVHMRVDQEPFNDKRVRQAMALVLDRNALIEGLFQGKADIGNDNPFAPVFPSTDTSVPQRELDVEQAKQLMADAGVDGFNIDLETWDNYEMKDLAVLIQNAAQQIGITIKPNVRDAGTYYEKYWLSSPLGITDYGHRGVPNVFLTAPLTSKGTWNAAHFANPDYDKLVADYVAALDLDSQRGVAKQIEELLIDETPIIFPYFYFHLSAERNNVTGAKPTGMGHIDLTQAGFTT